ncbi:MAG TPA: NmrA family NAD(P)-binding protein [Amycolatopsis sp.]|uniref:NmrA family NAD(P)-binding protein n=1 Tax=Amycolatopsis sp. TaxID=37632 RepID=UPI002B480BAE|nr:NmrA family NAD(P)-binding protein [Amycolatopsis sp.]HKS45850.1 NmrA family NAD(P)-binding protein [Amycolatopsis sp.]
MSDNTNRKRIPRSILIFGASGHIGGPLAGFLHRTEPRIRLRLASSKPERADDLRRDFPYAEAVYADYFDLPSLESAVEGMEGVFVITTAGTDERPAMTNLVAALRKAGAAVHILRAVGLQPEANPRRIPQSIRERGSVLPIQHPIAKKILDESELPVTYLNIGATFMDNLFWMKEGLRRERKLIWHNRLIPFIDPRDIAEVAGRLFLSDNHRHIGQFHTLNNGHDYLRYSDVAELMSEVMGEKITFDASKESFFKAYPQKFGARIADVWEFFEYEKENEVVWARNDFVERMLGRKPLTLREWLQENAKLLLT